METCIFMLASVTALNTPHAAVSNATDICSEKIATERELNHVFCGSHKMTKL